MKRGLAFFICLALLITMVPSFALANRDEVANPRTAIQLEFDYQKDELGFNPGNVYTDKVDDQWNDDGGSWRCIWYNNGDSVATVFSTSGPWFPIFGDFMGTFNINALTVIFAMPVSGGYVGYTVKNHIQDAAWWTHEVPALHKGVAALGGPISNEFWAVDEDGNEFLAQNFQKGAVYVYYDTNGNVVDSDKVLGASFEPFTMSEEQRQAEAAVAAYEAAQLTSLDGVEDIELLEDDAVAKVELVEDEDAKADLEARIAAKKAEIDALIAELEAAKIAILAEYDRLAGEGYNHGTPTSDVFIWFDGATSSISQWFVDGDSTATVFSNEGPWSWLGFDWSNLTVITTVKNAEGEYEAYSIYSDSQDAAWWTGGLSLTGAAISNEYMTQDEEGKDVLVQEFEKGTTYVYYDEDGEVESKGFNKYPWIIAEEAVAAYEAAPLTSFEEIDAAEALEVIAIEKVADVEDEDVRAALEARIAAKKEAVEAAKIALENDEKKIIEELSNPWLYYKFDESNGIRVWDYSGNRNNGILINDATWGAGQYGNAVVLDGINDYVELPENIISELEDFTIASWFNINTLDHGRIFDFGEGLYNNGVYPNRYITLMPYVPGSGDIRYETRFGGVFERFDVSPPQPLQTGEWYHIAITYDNATGATKMYLNGVEIGSETLERGPADMGNTSQNWIGRARYTGVDPYRDGMIDDFVIYDKVLGSKSIAALMNSGPLADEGPDMVYGDANGDGQVTNVDFILVRRFVAGIEVEIDEDAADVNLDGVIGNQDLILILRYLAGVIDYLGPDDSVFVEAAEVAVAAYEAAPVTTLEEIEDAEALEEAAIAAVNAVKSADAKAAFLARIEEKKEEVDAAKTALEEAAAEAQRQAEAEAAVAAYEAAALDSLDDVAAAEELGSEAIAKVELVEDEDVKAELEDRIAAKKAEVDAVKEELEAAKVAILAEFNRLADEDYNHGTPYSDVFYWYDGATKAICQWFVDGDSTSTVFSNVGPWGWLGFNWDNLTVIFAVKNDDGEYEAFTVYSDSQDAAWWTGGLSLTGAAISNEFWTVDLEGKDVLIQKFERGNTFVYYDEGEVESKGFVLYPEIVADIAVSAYEAAPITTFDEIDAAEALGLDAQAKVDALEDGDIKDELQARIDAQDLLVAVAKAELEAEAERQAEAEAAVVEYEEAALDSLDDVSEAELLEAEAIAKVELVEDEDVKAELEDRIAAKKAEVDAVKEELEAAKVAILAEFNRLEDEDYNHGTPYSDVFYWYAGGGADYTEAIVQWFVDGDSTATVFSNAGPWAWLGFDWDNLTVIFAVKNDDGEYEAFTVYSDSQDAAWWTGGLNLTGAAISNEFWTVDDDANDILVQNFEKGATKVRYDEGVIVERVFQAGVEYPQIEG